MAFSNVPKQVRGKVDTLLQALKEEEAEALVALMQSSSAPYVHRALVAEMNDPDADPDVPKTAYNISERSVKRWQDDNPVTVTGL